MHDSTMPDPIAPARPLFAGKVTCSPAWSPMPGNPKSPRSISMTCVRLSFLYSLH